MKKEVFFLTEFLYIMRTAMKSISRIIGILLIFGSFPRNVFADVDLNLIDPILVDRPDYRVFECSSNMFIEIPYAADFYYRLGGVRAENYFLFVKAEVLFLEDTVWNGLDKGSFELRHQDAHGGSESFPLNYMLTARESMINEWPSMSEPLFFGWLLPLNLVFEVPVNEKEGWTLYYRPAERGGSAICEVEVPIRFQ